MARRLTGYSKMAFDEINFLNRIPKDRRFILVFGVGLLLFGVFGLTRPHLDFVKGSAGAETFISIDNGATGLAIGRQLEQALVIKSSKKFVSEFLANPKANSISAGRHLIQTHLTAKEAIAQLLDQKRLADMVKVKEGSTLADVIKELKSNRNIVYRNERLSLTGIFSKSSNSLEGSLFPANYTFPPGTKIESALSAMVRRTSKASYFTDLAKGYQNFTPFNLLTIASMVQIEGDPSDYSKVARTIYNRLAIGMPLQLNSTVQYAANLRGKIALLIKSTQINSPYNTYLHVGLPPSPISNPSELAVKATLNPAIGNWLYFITVKPKDTRFTRSFDEFQIWNSEFNKNLSAGAFK